MEKLLLTTVEAADLLGISRSRMCQLLYAEEVKSLKIGALRRIPRQALHEYIKRMTTDAA